MISTTSSTATARRVLQTFSDQLAALSPDQYGLSITDPLASEPPDPDVAEPTSWSNVLWWPHASYTASKQAWDALVATTSRTGKARQFIGLNQDTAPVVLQRVTELLQETGSKTNLWARMALVVGLGSVVGLALFAGLKHKR